MGDTKALTGQPHYLDLLTSLRILYAYYMKMVFLAILLLIKDRKIVLRGNLTWIWIAAGLHFVSQKVLIGSMDAGNMNFTVFFWSWSLPLSATRLHCS